MSVFYQGWTNADEMFKDFEVPLENQDGIQVLFASYAGGAWGEGDAYVVFTRAGQLYEIVASHCSCNGLEGQWVLEATTRAAIRARLAQGRLLVGHGEGAPDALRRALEEPPDP